MVLGVVMPDQKFDWLKNDIARIEQKVDSLIEFKWKITGGALTIAFVTTVVFELAKSMIK